MDTDCTKKVQPNVRQIMINLIDLYYNSKESQQGHHIEQPIQETGTKVTRERESMTHPCNS